MSQDTSKSKIEAIKLSSSGLRGSIANTLASDATHFDETETQLLKFHGIYQQDDRDLRVANRKAGLEKAWSLMVRLNIPGGALTAAQWLDLDQLADTHANGTLRITTRQSIQFHVVAKRNLPGLIREINNALLTTLAACGDVQRNVMACPAPIDDEPHNAVRALVAEITRALLPRTGAYHEIWLDGERILTSRDESEDFYGEAYLPRKFKTGVALDTDNCVDIYSYDCGLVGLTEDSRLIGFNLLAGGGFGMTHRKPDTIARLASSIGFVPRERAVDAVRAVAAIFQDHGNREDRRHARLKYLLESWGVERFRAAVNDRLDGALEPSRPMRAPRQRDHLGPHEQGDDRHFFGVFVQNGRVRDTEESRQRTAFRQIAAELSPSVHLTPMQSILFGNLTSEQIDRLVEILREHHVPTEDRLTNARRYSMACPALPTCGLALAESERVAPAVFDAIADELSRLGLGDLDLNIRMTGCPNGCARPYNADIGLVGRKPGVYHVYVGGGLAGDRLADLYAADVAIDTVVETLRPLLERFRNERRKGEALGEFYQRLLHRKGPRTLLTGDESPTRDLIQVTTS